MKMNEKLILGTAQFGMPYGNFADTKAQNTDVINQIMNYCVINDIKQIDTAPSYGNFFDKKLKFNNFIIDSKVYFPNLEDLRLYFFSSLNKTLKLTHQKKISTLYLHNPEIFLDHPKHLEEINLLFAEAKNLGQIDLIGISLYNVNEIEKFLQRIKFDVVQFPINYIDANFRNSVDDLARLKNKYQFKIYARSIFLQGVLLNLDKLPNCLIRYEDELRQVKGWLLRHKLKPISACLSFVHQQELIDKYIIGVQSVGELLEILNTCIVEWPRIDSPTFHDSKLLDPRLWKN